MIRIYEYVNDVDLDDIPEENKHGNCYVVAMNTFIEKPYQYKLVHGIVTGQGAIEGIQYGHAWVEDGDTVIDNTVGRKIPKDVYYAIGNIDYVHRYNLSEVAKMVDKYETYGPWDKKILQYP